jgi:hypothetical protein
MSKPPTLKAATLDELRAKAVAQFGPNARITKADKVIKEGIGGLFAGSYIEGTVEIVSPAPVTPEVPHGFADLTGIEALLAQAGAGDDQLNGTPITGLPLPEVSTGGEDFGKLMNSLNAEIVDVSPPPPSVLAAAGDLVLVAGPGATSLPVAKAMAERTGAKLYTSGLIEAPGILAADGPHQVMEARAGGVLAGTAVIVAFGLGNPAWAGASAATAAALKADQVWLVVDARLKHEDTARWVKAALGRVKTAALAVTGSAETTTPSSVNALQIPVGWIDDGPSHATTLTDPGH